MIVPTNELMQASESLATRVCKNFWIQTRCPRCGSVLISNDIDVWCSFVGGNEKPACSFGLDYDVTVDGLPAAIEHERQQVKASDSDATGVSGDGHVQVANTFLAWCSLRVSWQTFADDCSPGADEFAQMIIDAQVDLLTGTPTMARNDVK